MIRLATFFVLLSLSCSGFALNTLAAVEEVVVDFSNRQMTTPLPIDRDMQLSFEDYYTKSFDEPDEPPFKKITFLKQPPSKYVGERVEKLLHGIEVDIPSEYDYYGYEIRRYMKSILTPSELMDSVKLADSIADARRARIIMEYWQRDLNQEMSDLRNIIENGDVTARVRNSFGYNESKVSQFIPEMFGWINRNIDFLEFLQQHRGQYFVRYPLYAIPDPDIRGEFMRLYNLREEARKRVVTNYNPFRAMIY